MWPKKCVMVKLVGAFSAGSGISSSYVKFLGTDWEWLMFFTMHQRLCSWRSASDWWAEQAGFALCAVLRAEQGSSSVSLVCWGRGGHAMSCAVPWLVLLSTSWEPPRPWGHTAASQPSPSCGSCVCPRALGQCEGSLWPRLPAQHHLLSLGSAVLSRWDNALPLWRVSKWGWVGRTQASVVFLWDSLGLRRAHLKVQWFRIRSNKELINSTISVVCSALGGAEWDVLWIFEKDNLLWVQVRMWRRLWHW